MASDFFGVNNNASFFDNMFGTSGSGGMGGSSVLGDYAMIRSGSYKKLLKSYYSDDTSKKSTDGTKSTEETSEQKAQKNSLMSTKSAASDLKNAAAALREAEGSGADRLEKAKDFVKAYNSMLDSMENIDDTKILQKSIWMINDFKVNQGLLKDAGISIGSDNKLTLDEDKFKEAKTSTLDTLFKDRNSLMGKVASKTFDIATRATNAVTKLNGGTTYTDKADYTKLNTSTLYNSLF